MMNEVKTFVMKRAWEIAREGAAQFGGKVKEYFSIALKMAWDETKIVADKVEIVAIKPWFVNKNFSNEQAYVINNDADFKIFCESEKAFKLKVMSDYGSFISWFPKSVCLDRAQYEAEMNEAANRFEKGLKRNLELLEEAKKLGVKGVRKGMRTATLEKKIAEFRKGA